MDPMRGIVVVLMNKLEKDKQAIELGPDDGPYCETFAVNLFSRANRVDRAGQADASTAKTFYVASIFIDVGPHPACGLPQTCAQGWGARLRD